MIANKKNAHIHDHNGVFGEKTELYFSILCGVFLVCAFIFEKTF